MVVTLGAGGEQGGWGVRSLSSRELPLDGAGAGSVGAGAGSIGAGGGVLIVSRESGRSPSSSCASSAAMRAFCAAMVASRGFGSKGEPGA